MKQQDKQQKSPDEKKSVKQDEKSRKDDKKDELSIEELAKVSGGRANRKFGRR